MMVFTITLLLTSATGRAEEPDKDGDGVADKDDECPEGPGDAEHRGCSFTQQTFDEDGEPAVEEAPLESYIVDSDKDGVPNVRDNCPNKMNPDQKDADENGTGDACDDGWDTPDHDADGVLDEKDNCRTAKNPDQLDTDGDKDGDICDDNDDGDGMSDVEDMCPVTAGKGEWDGCEGPPHLTGIQREIIDKMISFKFSFDRRLRFRVVRRTVEGGNRPHHIVLTFGEGTKTDIPDKFGLGEIRLGQVLSSEDPKKETLDEVVVSAEVERKYKVVPAPGGFVLRVYTPGYEPEGGQSLVASFTTMPAEAPAPASEPAAVAAAPAAPPSAPPAPSAKVKVEPPPEPVVLAQAPPPAPAPPPPQPPKVEPPPSSPKVPQGPPPSPPAPEVPAAPPPVVTPPPAPPAPAHAPPEAEEPPPAPPSEESTPEPLPGVEEVSSGPAKMVEGDRPRDTTDTERFLADKDRGCDDKTWKLRGATLRGTGVAWQDSWAAPIDEAARRLGQCGDDYRLEVCGVEDVRKYNPTDIDVRVAGGRDAVGATRARGRAERVFHILQNVLGREYTDQLGFCEDRILAPDGERGADIMFRYSPQQEPTVITVEKVREIVHDVIATDGVTGPEGPQGPPGPVTVGPPGPPGEGTFSVFQIGVNTQIKDTDEFLLLSLAQLRLGLGDLLLLQLELGGAQWRLTGGLGAGIRYELIEDWLAASAIGFFRARQRAWSDFETGLALGIEADIWDVVLELRGELKGLKGDGNVLHETWFPFVPAATVGGFVGWKF